MGKKRKQKEVVSKQEEEEIKDTVRDRQHVVAADRIMCN